MNEFFPLICGIATGLLLGRFTARRRPFVWLASSGLLGVAATFLTGEWRTSWAFLLVDIPLVAGAALTAHVLSRRYRLAELRHVEAVETT